MGKMKKNRMGRDRGDPVAKKMPLEVQLRRDVEVTSPTDKVTSVGTKNDRGDDAFVDTKLTKKILTSARQQQEELQEEFGVRKVERSGKKAEFGSVSFKTALSLQNEDDDHSEDDDVSEPGSDFYEDIQVDEADEAALAAFNSAEPVVKRTLADLIMEKLTEKRTELDTLGSESAAASGPPKLDPRVVDMYKAIGEILAKYRSGKLPKAFKVVPRLSNWEYVLHLTNPDKWSAAAVFQATRIFASSLNVKMAQRFFFYVLYPRVRDDIAFYKRLNFHLFMALKKALFKPAAFFKGILLPLCESGNATLREATIVASILAKCSIPMLHSSAALLKIAEMEYTGANSIFIKTLLDKKYALPFRVIDALVFHFIRFERETRTLPVLWHQALLVFVQRYKEDISSEQKDAIYGVLRVHCHPQIGPEIRRELQNSKSRDEQTTPSEGSVTSGVSAKRPIGVDKDGDVNLDDETIDDNYRELFG